MDSKTMRLAVLLSMGALTLILLVVYAMNKNARRPGAVPAASGVTDVQEADPGVAVSLPGGGYLQTIGDGFRAYGEQIGNQPKAFMYDENFFDPMQDIVTGISDGNQAKLSLEAVAVEGGIHVSVTNERGGLQEGVAFQVVVSQGKTDKETTWTDTDRDGQIDIPGLKSGSYRVRLIAVPGYEMPESPVTVKLEASVKQDAAAGQGRSGISGDPLPAEQEIPAGEGASLTEGQGQEVWDHAE